MSCMHRRHTIRAQILTVAYLLLCLRIKRRQRCGPRLDRNFLLEFLSLLSYFPVYGLKVLNSSLSIIGTDSSTGSFVITKEKLRSKWAWLPWHGPACLGGSAAEFDGWPNSVMIPELHAKSGPDGDPRSFFPLNLIIPPAKIFCSNSWMQQFQVNCYRNRSSSQLDQELAHKAPHTGAQIRHLPIAPTAKLNKAP